MDVGIYSYPHGDPLLIDKIVNEFLSQGKFDKLRKECMSDADTKPAYQNLQQRVESTVAQFLKKQIWRPDLNKNQLRDTLRKHILDSNFFDAGINRIVDQVVNPNVLATVFLPEVEEVVYNYLSIPRPPDKTQKRVFLTSDYEKLKPPGSENENQSYDEYEKINKSTKINDCLQRTNGMKDKYKPKDLINENSTKDATFEEAIEPVKAGSFGEDQAKAHVLKLDNKVNVEDVEIKKENVNSADALKSQTKFEFPSDESQESLDRLGVEKLRISETEPSRSIDSDNSVPLLELNEKSMSESRDSEDSIMNQMSPISQGRLTPDFLEDEREEKMEEKNALTFTEKIPKIKRNDSESSKSSRKEECTKSEKLDAKSIYSSDDSDSSKSYGKSDSDDKKSKDHKKKEDKKLYHKDEKKRKDDLEKCKKDDDHRKHLKERDKDKKNRDDKSKDGGFKDRDRKRERTRDKSRDRSRDKSRDRNREMKKSSSSGSSREKSISHKSSHHSHHRDSKSKDRSRDKKRKEEEKKKSKSADDHAKERNKKDDRRSTDRDNNERDKGSDSRSQGENRRREGEHKTEEEKHQETQKKEAEVEEDVEITPENEEVVIEMDGDWVPEGEEIVLVNEDEWVCSGEVLETKAKNYEEREIATSEIFTMASPKNREPPVDLQELLRMGALTKIKFSKVTDDFYVKFNSTGFKYFEDWERCKLDCEEEFKEFVDEAENNLDLISDESSESEVEFNFQEENLRTVNNLLRGLGNFKRSLTFDPVSSEFYKWSNTKFYQKFRRKGEKKKWKNAEKNESDESIKENIVRIYMTSEDFDSQKEKNKENLAREKKALHLKLLNRLKRRAIRQGKQRRRYRRKGLQEGIKEKNENLKTLTEVMKGVRQAENGRLYGPETKLANRIGETQTAILSANHAGKITNRKINVLNKFEPSLAEGESSSPNDKIVISPSQSGTNTFEIQSNNHLSTEHFKDVDNSSIQKRKKLNGLNLAGKDEENIIRKEKEGIFGDHHIRRVCHMNIGPDHNDCNGSSSLLAKEDAMKHKRPMRLDTNDEGVRERKQQRRSYCQKYDSQDLYKPRPILNSNRLRGRGRGNVTAEADPQM